MDIEEIRKKKLEELKKRQMQKEQNQPDSAEAGKERILAIARTVCTERAYDRLTNLMHANQERFQRALEFCIASHRRTGKKVEDALLLKFLETLSKMNERKTKIEFKRK